MLSSTRRDTLALLLATSLLSCARADPPEPGGPVEARTTPSLGGVLRRIDPPAAPGSLAPDLQADGHGVLSSWLEPLDSGHRLVVAELTGEGWGPVREVARGEAFFANWADLPRVRRDHGGALYAHWLEKLGEATYAYGVQTAWSEDGGRSWRATGLLHDDRSPSEHGFVSWVPDRRRMRAFWLDGRRMADEPPGPMQLRTRPVAGVEQGVSHLLDDRVCECCATDAAWTRRGAVVVYRDRSAEEVRDVGIVRQVAGGWSRPALVHADGWRIAGCPVNGPAVAAGGDRVAVAWFTAAGDDPRVQLAFSEDAGSTFGSPVVVDGGDALGRVDVVLYRAGAVVSWMGREGEETAIRVRRVGPDGTLGAVRKVAVTSARRSAGVPRMVASGDRLVLAWVEDATPSRLAVATMPAR